MSHERRTNRKNKNNITKNHCSIFVFSLRSNMRVLNRTDKQIRTKLACVTRLCVMKRVKIRDISDNADFAAVSTMIDRFKGVIRVFLKTENVSWAYIVSGHKDTCAYGHCTTTTTTAIDFSPRTRDGRLSIAIRPVTMARAETIVPYRLRFTDVNAHTICFDPVKNNAAFVYRLALGIR